MAPTVAELINAPDRAFDAAVYRYTTQPDRTLTDQDAFRDPAVVERTMESLARIADTLRHRQAQAKRSRRSQDEAAASRLLTRVSVEMRACRPLAGQAREARLSRQRGRGARYRAMVRLSKEPDLAPRFLGLLREEQAKDRVDQD